MTETAFVILDRDDTAPSPFDSPPRDADGWFTLSYGADSLHICACALDDYLAEEESEDQLALLRQALASLDDPTVYQVEFRSTRLLGEVVLSIPAHRRFFVENVHSLVLDRAMVEEARRIGIDWPFARPSDRVPPGIGA